MEMRVSDIKECSERDILAELRDDVDESNLVYPQNYQNFTPVDQDSSVGDNTPTIKKISDI